MSWRWRIAQFFELLWWRRYLAGRDATVYLDWKKKYWLRFLEWADLDGPAPIDLLDAGCGPAGIFIAFTGDSGFRVMALDPLLDAYERIFPHFQRSAYPEIEFINGSIEGFERADSFDRIYCLNAINHVKDLDAALTALYRSLRPAGDVLLSVDVHRNRLASAVFRRIPFDVLHPHQYGAADYAKRLQQAGFRIEWVRTYQSGFLFDYTVFRCRK